MIIIITGASHTGKTVLTQKLLKLALLTFSSSFLHKKAGQSRKISALSGP